MANKVFTIQTTKVTGRGDRPNRVNTQTGTVEELTQYFSYTLEIGNSWNNKISRNPKTIKSLVSNLQKSYDEKEGSCYDRTSVKLIDNPVTV